MADWTTLDTNTLLPGEPVTSAVMLALEENPRALADQASGAPKIASKTLWAQGSTVTFSNLDDYAGIFLHITCNTGGVSPGVDFQYSDDGGSTFSTSIEVSGNTSIQYKMLTLFFDFATGNVKASAMNFAGSGDPTPSGKSATIAGSSLDITDVRISGLVAGSTILAIPQGGESAS